MAGPLTTIVVGLHTRLKMRDAGYNTSEIRTTMAKYNAGVVDQAATLTNTPLPAEPAPGSNDAPGGFLAALLAFISSPQGQALIMMIIQLLMAGGMTMAEAIETATKLLGLGG